MNLEDAWYIKAISALITISNDPLNVAVMGSSVAHENMRHSALLDAHGNVSVIPAFLRSRDVDHSVILDGDTQCRNHTFFELTGDFDLVREPIVFVSMSSFSKLVCVGSTYMAGRS